MVERLLILLYLCIPVQHSSWSERGVKSPILLSQSQSIYQVVRNERIGREADDKEAQWHFSSSIQKTIATLNQRERKGEILCHTRFENKDVIIFLTSREKHFIQAKLYAGFMSISHLPVTAITIILPDLLENSFSLPSNFTESNTYKRLKKFNQFLERPDIVEIAKINSTEERRTATQIIKKVSRFVSRVLNDSEIVNREYIRTFTDELKAELKKAAKFAIQDYFYCLNNIIDGSNISMDWSVIVAIQEFSHHNSFLIQYYKDHLENTYSPGRIAVMPPSLCNGTTPDFVNLSMTSSFEQGINDLFNNDLLTPLHTILSDVAKEILNSTSSPPPLNLTSSPPPLNSTSSSPLNFERFYSRVDRIYIIVIVLFLTISASLFIVVFSIYYEDRLMKMESAPMKKKLKNLKGPSLLTPIEKQGFTSSCSTYHRLKENIGKKEEINHSLADRNTNWHDRDTRSSPLTYSSPGKLSGSHLSVNTCSQRTHSDPD